MRKRSTEARRSGGRRKGLEGGIAGVDLGDRTSDVCVIGEDGELQEEAQIPTTRAGMERWFGGRSSLHGRVRLQAATVTKAA